MKQMKSKLQARLKNVIKEYFEQRKKNATVKDLERFINTTIHYESMKHSKSCFTVTISAKADDAFKIVYNDPVSNTLTKVGAAVGAGFGATGGGPIGMFAGAAAGATFGAAAGAAAGVVFEAAAGVVFEAAKATFGGGGARDYKESFTAEEIFQLLETDGFERQGGRVRCTIRLT